MIQYKRSKKKKDNRKKQITRLKNKLSQMKKDGFSEQQCETQLRELWVLEVAISGKAETKWETI